MKSNLDFLTLCLRFYIITSCSIHDGQSFHTQRLLWIIKIFSFILQYIHVLWHKIWKKKSINCYAETQVIRNEIKQSTNRARRKWYKNFCGKITDKGWRIHYSKIKLQWDCKGLTVLLNTKCVTQNPCYSNPSSNLIMNSWTAEFVSGMKWSFHLMECPFRTEMTKTLLNKQWITSGMISFWFDTISRNTRSPHRNAHSNTMTLDSSFETHVPKFESWYLT